MQYFSTVLSHVESQKKILFLFNLTFQNSTFIFTQHDHTKINTTKMNHTIKKRKKEIHLRVDLILYSIEHLNRELRELQLELTLLDEIMDMDDDEKNTKRNMIHDNISRLSNDSEMITHNTRGLSNDSESNNTFKHKELQSIKSKNYSPEIQHFESEPDFDIGERIMIFSDDNNHQGECGVITSFVGRRVNIKLDRMNKMVQRYPSSLISIL